MRNAVGRYGLSALGGQATGTLRVGVSLAGEERTWTVGYGLRLGQVLDMGPDASRRETANDDTSEHAIELRLRPRW